MPDTTSRSLADIKQSIRERLAGLDGASETPISDIAAMQADLRDLARLFYQPHADLVGMEFEVEVRTSGGVNRVPYRVNDWDFAGGPDSIVVESLRTRDVKIMPIFEVLRLLEAQRPQPPSPTP